MKNISTLVKTAQKLLDENSPVILTGVAVAGVVGTAWLTFKGTQKATLTISEESDRRNVLNVANGKDFVPVTNQEKLLLTWKFYAPSVIAVVGTSTCMILATKISLNRTAALAGALVIVGRDNETYKDKVKQLLGDKKHIQVVDATAEDRVASIPSSQFIYPRPGEQIFVDSWSGRQLSTTKQQMEAAVNSFNKEMLYNDWATLGEFYDRIGLEPIQQSGVLGWNKNSFLELVYTAVLREDEDQAVIVFKFDKNPMPDFRDSVDVSV